METLQQASFSADAIQKKPQWSAVFALSLGAFVLVASEFMPVSLLTPIARDLQVSEGQAGQAISISGAFALLTSLLLSSLIGQLDRKVLLLSLTLLTIISGAIVTVAPNYQMFMMGRVLIGGAIGGFWAMSAATAIRLVPTDQIPRALAILNGGNALATVIAAPLGSLLGDIIGWRGAFFCIVPVVAITFVWMLISLPSLKVEFDHSTNTPWKLLKQPSIRLGMLTVSLFFMGQFALFTYVRPFLERVTQVSASSLSLMLLVVGIAGFIGSALIGRFLKNSLYQSLIVIPTLMAVMALALMVFGKSMVITGLILGLWGLVATAAPVAWWTWLSRNLPRDAEAGGGLMVAVIQLAITLGATLGGVLFDLSGYQASFGTSAALLSIAALLAIFAARSGTAARKEPLPSSRQSS